MERRRGRREEEEKGGGGGKGKRSIWEYAKINSQATPALCIWYYDMQFYLISLLLYTCIN